jgi:hypothetical protein
MADQAYLDLRSDPKNQELLYKFSEALGDRNGLEQLKVLFRELDTDGSGLLSYDEFKAGVKQFGMELDDNEVGNLLRLLDANGDGELSLEEFEFIAKAEMECADLTDSFGEHAQEGKLNVADQQRLDSAKEAAIQAAHSGTRYTRTQSVMHDPKKQGCPEMLSAFALQARMELKEDEGVKKLVWTWWCKALEVGHLESEEAADVINRVQYLTLSVSLNKMLDSNVEEDDAKLAAEKDWATDKAPGHEHMDFEHFFNSMFELCDTWVDGLDPREYVHFLRKCETVHLHAEEAYQEERRQRALLHLGADLSAAAAIAKVAAAAAANCLLKMGMAVKQGLKDAEKKAKAQEAYERKMKLTAHIREIAAAAAAMAVRAADVAYVKVARAYGKMAYKVAQAAAADALRASNEGLMAYAEMIRSLGANADFQLKMMARAAAIALRAADEVERLAIRTSMLCSQGGLERGEEAAAAAAAIELAALRRLMELLGEMERLDIGERSVEEQAAMEAAASSMAPEEFEKKYGIVQEEAQVIAAERKDSAWEKRTAALATFGVEEPEAPAVPFDWAKVEDVEELLGMEGLELKASPEAESFKNGDFAAADADAEELSEAEFVEKWGFTKSKLVEQKTKVREHKKKVAKMNKDMVSGRRSAPA